MKDETLLPDDLIHMAISAIEDLLDHCDPSTDHYCGVWADVPDKLRASLQSGNSGQAAGYVLVPVEFTPEMRNAWDSAPNNSDDDHVNMMAAYRAMLAAAPKAPDGWIPVSERMPNCFYYVLVADEHDDFAIASPVDLSTGDKCAFRMNDGCIFFATHWQPIPDMPKVTP